MLDPFDVEITRTSDLSRAGLTSRQVSKLVETGSFVRVRRGMFVQGTAWRELRTEGRMVVAARAWAAVAGSEPVLSHVTAAAVHGLPLFRSGDIAVHTVVPDPRKGATPGIVRHRGSVHTALTVVRVLVVTDLARTIADTARFCLAETSVAITDAALRTRSTDPDHPGVVLLRRQARELAAQFPRGSMRSQKVIEFADPRAQLPGESVSRLYLVRLGFATPRLQVLVVGPDGRRYFVDFALDDVNAFGEFDGKGKYADPAYLAGRTPEQALIDEKWREDAIRGTSQRRLGRWGMEHIPTHIVLGTRLACFGIVPRTR